MISRAIVIWLLLVISTILISVQIGLKAEKLEDSIQDVQRQQEVERDRIRVLRASYAYLTAADQLRPLVQRHLALAPIKGDQVVAMADLPRRVPVPAPRGGLQDETAPAPSLPQVAPSRQAPPSSIPSQAAPPAGQPRVADGMAIPRSPEPTPPKNTDRPPWLADQKPMLQPVGLPSQKGSSL